ncbi:MAG: hypothetical protein ACQETH_12510 [Candidatus Rifleibacteriota bacterium]
MTILATIWLITKWLFIAATVVALILFLLFLFHPLRFDLNLRSTIKGQRGQLWFVYLFRIIKVGVIASPHTQDIILKIFFWKIRLKRFQREKPVAKDSDQPPPDIDPSDSTKKSPDQSEKSDFSDKSVKRTEGESKPDLQQPGKEEKEPDSAKPSSFDKSESEKKETDHKSEDKNDEALIAETGSSHSSEEEIEDIETSEVKPASDKDINRPVKPLSETDPFAGDKESDSRQREDLDEEPKKGEKTTVTIRKRLRQLRKKISRKYLMGKKWLKVFLKKYKLLKPILKKLWKRAKSGFEIKNSAILLKYALHEPYLTGMFQGNLSIFSGVMQRFGIEFIPVPLFGQPTVYTRAKTAAIIKPWRFVFAFFSLLFEKVLWKEFYNLFKWYRAQKKEH